MGMLIAAASTSIVLAAFYQVTQLPDYHQRHHVYCDDDGEALPNKHPDDHDRTTRILVALFTSAALLVSAWNWVVQGQDARLAIITVAWIIISVNSFLLTLRSPQRRRRHSIGLLIAVSSLSSSLALAYTTFKDFPNHFTLWLQVALGIALAYTCCSLQRRPAVYHQGRIVDGQFTCSAISRYTFGWIRPLLDQARRSHGIEYDDLPALGHAARSQDLNAAFQSDETMNRPLWRIIVKHHFACICRQWAVAIFESIASVIPAVCMWKILTLLEDPTPLHSSSIWLWVACLATSKVLHVGLANWLQWINFAIFAIPVRSQLSAVIFAKSLRMVTVQAETSGGRPIAKNTSYENDESEMEPLLPQETDDQKEQVKDETPDDTAAKGIVNLLGVDVQRVADFCGYNQDLLRGVIKVAIAAGLLVKLLGGWSTLAGFAVPVLLQPLNRIATKYYTKRQLDVMAARDTKAHVVTEALHGIRQIKFSASEKQWEKRILDAREQELKSQWSVYVWAIFLTFTWIAMPALIGATALSVYAWQAQQIKASLAFTALSIFSSLEWTIGAVPTTITEMLDARVSTNRIHQHLRSEERLSVQKPSSSVELKNASIAWPSDSKAILRDLNLRFPTGALSVIHGKTGTGKSLLLAAIIGEASILNGDVQVPRAPPMHMRGNEDALLEDWIIPSALAFVGQVPWIENTSIKNTVLFGLPYHHERYTQVLHACALLPDIAMLPDGEDTEVGATGINLSGGQRWRLTFARALYSRAGVLVLDDIFSAVDSHVGRHLLDHGILGPLGANRTKILVTHHAGLVDCHAAYIVTLTSNGTASVVERPSPKIGSIPAREKAQVQRSRASDTLDDIGDSENEPLEVEPKKFVEDEVRAQGRVKWTVYKRYLLASGGLQYWIITFFMFLLAALSTIGRSYWLRLWTSTYADNSSAINGTSHHMERGTEHQQHQLSFYLSIYILISFISIVLVGIKIIFVLVSSLRAARHFFEVAALNVLQAPLRWLDTQPVGRILNRFVGDFALLDSKLGGNILWCVNGLFSIVTIVASALFVSLWMSIPVLVLSLICIYVVHLYLDAARDVKRLESSAKSPVFELVGTVLSGLPTIRSFGRVDDYLDRMYGHIDRYSQASWHILLATQWMKFRLGVLGVAFTFCIAAGIVYFPGIDASLAGFALSFALDFSAVAENTIARYTATELDMNSMERVLEYIQLDTESAAGDEAKPSWPSRGHIIFRDLEVAYGKDLPPVLKGISFEVPSHHRVGIIGRTGSGKSSLTLALFRFLQVRRGSIEIDGVDLGSLKLHDVRSRLVIIPQDPVLFSGTLRSNLDPSDKHTDHALLDALARVSPAQASSREGSQSQNSIFENLQSSISRGGSNLSQGEKQLICLARAILTRPKILILDEATSAVDMETDALIQRSIRDEFRNSTVLVVAHRLSTVADFDKILVLSDGNLVEYDEPQALAQRKGPFWEMLRESGEDEALRHLLK